MKNLCITLALIGAFSFSTQGAFAAWQGMQSLNPMPYISYLNPLPYIGIGENKTNFSLNPFTGFKNCNKCKVKKVKCDECTRVKTPVRHVPEHLMKPVILVIEFIYSLSSQNALV